VDIASRKKILRQLLDVAVDAVDPEQLTNSSLISPVPASPITVIAIGKAAAAMCRGAASRLGGVHGICVTNAPDVVPDGIELVVGNHPIPGDSSFHAGRRVLEVAEGATDKIIALVSGGGSALCEHPLPGISTEFIKETNKTLVSSGASIAETNVVRRHLSAIKGGGLIRAAGRPIDTYLISDVCGGDPAVIASGPTIPTAVDPDAALSVMNDRGVTVPASVKDAMRDLVDHPGAAGEIRVIADGHTAAAAFAEEGRNRGLQVSVLDGWLQGPLPKALSEFMTEARPGLTIATGECDLAVEGDGRGGRNTHAALLAAECLIGTEEVFAAFATDGVDGNSMSAGAIVDGGTVARTGDPRHALEHFDSATYLHAAGDLTVTGPTGTNVSDLWVLWR
jgi:glycerate 2-kinase